MPFVQHQYLVRHPGNQALFDAVELAVLSILRGRPVHIHVEGLRGTGKTSVLRSARAFLPYIQRVRGCRLNCDPAAPHCPDHRDMDAASLGDIGAEWIRMPFLEISHSAKMGTVVGSLDLSRLTDPEQPEAALLPGTLARAHRGIVVVDEINRLADTSPELTDVLLDALGTKPGRLQIEETGLSPVSLPIDVSVWAASNPDEEPGPLEDIRRQLADRFDLVINVERPDSPEAVSTILGMSGRLHTHSPGGGPRESRHIRSRLTRRARREWPVLSDRMRHNLGRVYVDFGLESLRALEAWQLASMLLALREDERAVAGAHLLRTATWALHHRVELNTLAEILRFLEEGMDGEGDCPHGHHGPGAGGGEEGLVASLGVSAGRSVDEVCEEAQEEIRQGPLERMFAPIRSALEGLTGSRDGSPEPGRQSERGGCRRPEGRGHMPGSPATSTTTTGSRAVRGPSEPAVPLVALDSARLWWDGRR